MKAILLPIALLSLTGCNVMHVMMEQPGDRAKRMRVNEPNEQGQPKSNALLAKHTEVFTGKVVMIDGAYRLQLLKNPDMVLRLTRARRESEFAADPINLRKYYEKTISVNGTLHDEWIFGADIVGQWTPPGGETGPNMNAPKASKP